MLTQLPWPARRAIRSATIALLIAVPWLNPVAVGPSPAVLPLIVSWLCVVGLLLLGAAPGAEGVSRAWLAAALISSLLGLLQYFNLARFFSPWVDVAPLGVAFGNLRQRNQLASLTSIGLLALLWLVASGRLHGYALWMVLLLAVGNAATASRTGLVQLAVIALSVVGWGGAARAQRLRLCLAALAAYAVAAGALPWLLHRFTGHAGSSVLIRLAEDLGCSSRTLLWSNVLHLIAQQPWLGWGWGELDYAHYITLYPGERFCDILDNAHNLPLHLAVELGIPAALLGCGGLGWLVLRAKPWRETDPTRQMAWGVLAVILLHSLVEYPLWYGPFQMALGLCLGLLWHRSAANEGSYKPNQGGAPTWRAGVAMFLIASCLYAAWDYHRISQIYLPPEARHPAYREDTLAKVRGSWLFRSQVRFAELTITPLTRDNAEWTYKTARDLLHYSPEPRVIEKVIDSAVLLGRDDEALAHLARYRVAFAKDHARWAEANARGLDLNSTQPPAAR
ncbi:MAG: PglL family O-oligosaccharyltransferase [Burkholderiaceae bacterium]